MLLTQDPAHEERAEQLQVAKECLCDAFEIDADAETPSDCSLVDAWGSRIHTPELSDSFARFILDLSNKVRDPPFGCSTASAAGLAWISTGELW